MHLKYRLWCIISSLPYSLLNCMTQGLNNYRNIKISIWSSAISQSQGLPFLLITLKYVATYLKWSIVVLQRWPSLKIIFYILEKLVLGYRPQQKSHYHHLAYISSVKIKRKITLPSKITISISVVVFFYTSYSPI